MSMEIWIANILDGKVHWLQPILDMFNCKPYIYRKKPLNTHLDVAVFWLQIVVLNDESYLPIGMPVM